MDFLISKIFLDIKKYLLISKNRIHDINKLKSWHLKIDYWVGFFSIKNISWYQELFPDIEKSNSWYQKIEFLIPKNHFLDIKKSGWFFI